MLTVRQIKLVSYVGCSGARDDISGCAAPACRQQVCRPMYIVYWRFQGASTSQVTGARNEMIMDDYDGQMIFGDLVDLKLPDIRLTGEENPRKKPHPGNQPRPGIEPGPAAWQARMLPLAVGNKNQTQVQDLH